MAKFSNIVQVHIVFILHYCIRSFKTEKECDERLYRVMRKLDESGLTGEVPEVSDRGRKHVVSLQVCSDKVEAIVRACTLKNHLELCSFLGLAQYCVRFIPKLNDRLYLSRNSGIWRSITLAHEGGIEERVNFLRQKYFLKSKLTIPAINS